MSDLRRKIRQTHHSGAWVYATVEEVNLGYATVRLAKNGSRMTNLPTTGGNLVPGALAIVDWSAGIPPTVRPVTIVPEDEADPTLEEAAMLSPEAVTDAPTELLSFVSGDHGARVYQWGGTPTQGSTSWNVVTWTHTEWDTDTFFDINEPGQVTILASGLYLFIADIGFVGGGTGGTQLVYTDLVPTDGNNDLEVVIEGDTYGEIAYNKDWPIARISGAVKVMQAFGNAPLDAGEIVQVKVKTLAGDNPLSHSQGMYPRLTFQWMGNP